MAPPDRLFVAHWPVDAVCSSLAAIRDDWQWSTCARPTPDARLHVTLRFIGAVPAARVDAFAAALVAETGPFVLHWDRASLWKNGIAALEPTIVPPSLTSLRAKLDARLADLGTTGEARAYRPHVTLARDALGSIAPPSLEPIEWRVDDYALVRSRGGRYTILNRYPLRSIRP